MELRHFRYFVAVAETENVSRAALKLRVSQPGLSRQIRDLEDEIGFSLFERGAKSLKLTDAGKTLLTEAKSVLQYADEAVKKARIVSVGVGGEINVGYAPSLTVQILPVVLRVFQEKYPGVRVVLHDLSTEEMLAQLCEKKLEVGLSVRPPAKLLRGLNFQELARYEICVAVTPKHPLAKMKSISLEQISREPLIAYSRKDYPEYHLMLQKLFALVGRKPKIAVEYDGVTSIVAAVESGRGFALVPSCVACLVGPRLKLLPLRPSPPLISVGAVWQPSSKNGLAEKFIACAGVGK